MFRKRDRGIPDPEQERGKKILREMDKLERRGRPRAMSCAPWLIALIVAALIVAVLFANRDRFAPVWRHFARPDSIPGISP